MNPVSAWQKVVLKNYANFSGRARRAEYWHFALANFLAYIALVILSLVSDALGLLSLLYWIGVLVPSIAVAIRRMHDVGKSGWWLLISLVPVVGLVLILVWVFSDSQRGTNEWGTSEKYPA